MTGRYILAPEAAADLVRIWRYIEEHGGLEAANRVEAVIREKLYFLAKNPGAGHWRRSLTPAEVKFFPVYSYLIVYRSDTDPLQVVSILHGRRDLGQVLRQRF